MDDTLLHAPALVRVGIPLIGTIALGGSFAALLATTPRDRRGRTAIRFGVPLLLWVAVPLALAASGVLADQDARPPRMALILPGVFVLPWLVARSEAGQRLARSAPLWALVLPQTFRLPLELVMHEAAQSSVMPVQMSFSGFNFDVLSGASALVVGLVLYRKPEWRGLAFAWNLLGTALLFIIVGIALASLPIVAAFGDAPEQLNTWVAHAPYVLLPTGAVASAWFGHLVLYRALRSPPAPG